jgi:protein-tyrosine phosphatase
MEDQRIGVLFVCLGNICRSPLAEGIFRHQVREAGLAGRFHIDSAGTSGYHDGEQPDRRTWAVARQRGIELEGRSRRITEDDIAAFDYLVVMDVSNLREVNRLARRVRPGTEVHLLRSFDASAAGDLDVPDPYFGGESGFEVVHDLVERACRGLLDHIREQHAL